MKLINLDAFVEGLEGAMEAKRNDRDHAAENGWFDKAAKLDNEIEGLRKAKFMATSGDYIQQHLTENEHDWVDNSGSQPALINVDVLYSNSRIRRYLAAKELNWSLDTSNPILKYKKTIRNPPPGYESN